MASENDSKYLKRCLQKTIEAVSKTIDALKVTNPADSENLPLDTDNNTFSLNEQENKLIDDLKTTIENLLNDNLLRSSGICKKYLLNLLHQYEYDDQEKKFKSFFNQSILSAFQRDLQGMLSSIDAFLAAWNGDLNVVEEFIKKYPTFKDKPGLWGTTLLYSSAKNNRMNIVKYLIETAKCSINAQNEQDLEKGLLTTTSTSSESISYNPTAASTALHGACFNGHLNVVKYLIEHGADYSIKNQAAETPIMNGERHKHIQDFFRNLLVLGYSRKSKSLPETTILKEKKQEIVDCIWEYKPFEDEKWYPFSPSESNELHQSLIVKPNEKFKYEVFLRLRAAIYSVSTIQFLRSGKDDNRENNLAWVRCRGSSILNFDCYALWQIMFIKHTAVKSKSSLSSLKILNIPTIYDSQFNIELNAWYNCHADTNTQLDDAINYRKKSIELRLDFISDDQLIFNLETFAFSNQEGSIQGFIRWIPKLISNNERNKNKLKSLDNFSTLTNLDPIPLTTAHLKQLSHIKNLNSSSENDNDDDYSTQDIDEENYNLDQNDKTNKSPDNALWCFNDSTGTVLDSQITTDDDVKDEKINDYLRQTDDKSHSSSDKQFTERINSSTNVSAISEEELNKFKKENEHIAARLKAANEKSSELKKLLTDNQSQNQNQLKELSEQIDKLNKEQTNLKRKEENVKEIERNIKIIDYERIEKHIVHEFLTSKFALILNCLKKTKNKYDYYTDKIPQMIFTEKNNLFTFTITGFQEHQQTFKDILKEILNISSLTQRAKEYYQRHLNRFLKLINNILIKIQSTTQNWKQYSNFLLDLLKEKIKEYSILFNDFISEQAREISEKFILNNSISSWNEITKQTELFIQKNPFENQIESLKRQALEQFITQNISFQRLKLERKPSQKSIEILKDFIKKIQNSFEKKQKYIGYQLEQFRLIPELLKRLMTYYCCFATQLPLFESSKDLLRQIEQNTVITIATSTGSGKSTLLPALLVAEGYSKVMVTQPRRLPCKLISQRVNETMTSDTNPKSDKIAGWAISGEESNPRAPILYLTDGLLKERLLYNENFIPPNSSIVLFIDEVHERSVNIDLCLALIARMLSTKQQSMSRLKIIISSATLDTSVPNLFKKIPQIKFSEFTMPLMGTLYPVTKYARPNENILDIVQELYKKRQRHDQILCFVNSVSEVTQCVRLLSEISRGTIIAYPLVQSQQAQQQELFLEHGSVFFSTTVAETSLTFPSLKYVIDTGMINIPVYDLDSKRTILKEVRAAESTIKQRLGRLGRTRPGEYYALYDFDVKQKQFPTAQICQSDLLNIEFTLRKSPLKQGLNYLKQYLPDKPSQQAINLTIQELIQFKVLGTDANNQLTNYGKALAKLPDFGSVPMSKCVYAALEEYRCGRDLICISSMLSVLNTTIIFKSIPQNFKSPDGDFMTLLNIMNEILLLRESVAPQQFNLKRVCQAKGLTNIEHLIRQALKRYTNLEQIFNQSNEYREKAQIKCDKWEFVAKALLAGYSDNVFISMKDLQDKIHQFMRYNDRKDLAILDLQSTLTRPISQAPVSLIFARDVRYLTAIRSTAVLSFVGEIKSEWLNFNIQRQIDLNNEEETYLNTNNKYLTAVSKFSNKINMQLNNLIVSLKGPASVVLNAELHLRQEMITEFTFNLENKNPPNSAEYANLARNLKSVMKMTRIFKPMVWRWEAQKQVKITVNSDTATKTCRITIKGRDSDIKIVKEEFDSFFRWLQDCAVIRHPNAGVPPRILGPQMRKDCRDIEERICHITDSKRTLVDLYNGVKGSKATRETRMEVVAWIAVCKFDCRLEGGFVRDWVVGNYTSRPNQNPTSWLEYTTNKKGQQIPAVVKQVFPADLDCHLPTHAYFDVEKFQDELYKFDIKCDVVRENWRYIILVDKDTPTGPFTMDLIEPHVALTHDRIDFDVNNLSLEKDFTRDLAMRVDIQQKPYSIELEQIVDNIKNKRFQVLRPIDTQVKERITKMTTIRGWTQSGQSSEFIPHPPPKYYSLLIPLPSSTTLYQSLAQEMRQISGSLQIVSIEQVKNPYLEEAYEAMKKIISKQCTGFNPNERLLFHGTKDDGIKGIAEDGFDDRFFIPTGAWGHGGYFADDPRKSHNYTVPNAIDQTRTMFYNKVLLGNESIQNAVDQTLVSAPKGFHSVRGTGFHYTEYIIYRYGQALPYLKITYKA
ncbi:unnamed protein product [Adineta steineri]|uniref:Poly [ADP-ribose] polymerase n=1 Tax=Adineta steineri TaxID=433720 RepID=A0A813ZFI8_9BILA|nr:unnamed protein product [Adineta steineri]CAF1428790.1 unnamed protein product [Adineta steineri]